MVTWDTIECIESNGIITNYTVVFQEQGGAEVPGRVNILDRNFSAEGLTPYTRYTFQVAGVNDVGTGPFTNVTTVTTAEDGLLIDYSKLLYLILYISVHSSPQFLVLCLTSLPSQH